MMTSQILNFVDVTKTQKSRYLENKTLFFLEIKTFINYTSRATLWQKNSFLAEVTLKGLTATINFIKQTQRLEQALC